MLAAQNGHTNVVKTLLQHGASVDMQEEVSNSFHFVWSALLHILPFTIQKCLKHVLKSSVSGLLISYTFVKFC